MKHHRIGSFVAVALTVALLAGSMAGAQAASAPKKITITQAKKLYTDAVAATVRWQQNNPFTTTQVIRSGRSTIANTSITVDREGNVQLLENGKVYVLGIGMVNYAPLASADLDTFERALARKIGLSFDREWVRIDAEKIMPGYEPSMLTDEYRIQASPASTMFYGLDVKRSTATLAAGNGTQTVKIVTKSAKSPITYTFTIASGRISSSSFTGDGQTVTSTFKSTTKVLTAPKGPYFEWATLYLHPEYQAGRATQIATRQLESLAREATAIAAFDGRDTPSDGDWVTVTGESEDLVLYDKGVELTVRLDEGLTFSMCGVFTPTGASLNTESCATLGFTKR
jgi:hypothetical protein